MLIPILYKSGRYDMVKPTVLDRLLAAQEVVRFRRASGWVRVGHDPIRLGRSVPYGGPDRRHPDS